MEQNQETLQKEILISANKSSFRLGLTFVFLIAVLIGYANYILHFNGLVINDSHDYAQLAKNVSEGNGYSTSVLRPLAYRFFNTLPQPEVTRIIGYPYLLGLSFRIFGQTDFTIVLVNGVFFVALILFVYLLAYELSKNAFLSMISSLIVLNIKSFLDHSLQAEPNIMYSALYVAFFYLYVRYPGKPLMYGLMLGLLQLVRANTQFVFSAFFLVYVFHGKENLRGRLFDVGNLSIGFLMGILPHLVRNYSIIGNPFFSLYSYSFLLFTKSFPVYSIWTQISDVNPIAFVISHPMEMISKSYDWFWMFLRNSLDFYTPVVLLLTGAAFFMSVENSLVRMLKIITIAAIIVQTVLLLPLGSVPYYYMFFFPIMIVVSVINTADLFKKYAPIVLLFALIVFAYTAIPYWKTPKLINPFISMGQQVEQSTEKDSIVLSDMPWELAWYANRRAIWIPYDIDTLKKIRKTLRPSYALLSGRIYAPYKDNVWIKIINDATYAKSLGYEFKEIIFFHNRPIAVLFKISEK